MVLAGCESAAVEMSHCSLCVKVSECESSVIVTRVDWSSVCKERIDWFAWRLCPNQCAQKINISRLELLVASYTSTMSCITSKHLNTISIHSVCTLVSYGVNRMSVLIHISTVCESEKVRLESFHAAIIKKKWCGLLRCTHRKFVFCNPQHAVA